MVKTLAVGLTSKSECSVCCMAPVNMPKCISLYSLDRFSFHISPSVRYFTSVQMMLSKEGPLKAY